MKGPYHWLFLLLIFRKAAQKWAAFLFSKTHRQIKLKPLTSIVQPYKLYHKLKKLCEKVCEFASEFGLYSRGLFTKVILKKIWDIFSRSDKKNNAKSLSIFILIMEKKLLVFSEAFREEFRTFLCASNNRGFWISKVASIANVYTFTRLYNLSTIKNWWKKL